jgi:hypothetical protein
MLRYVVCSVTLFVVTLGYSYGLHRLQEAVEWTTYLVICAVICGLMYLGARAYDARHPVQEVLPPEPRDPRISKPSPRLLDAD